MGKDNPRDGQPDGADRRPDDATTSSGIESEPDARQDPGEGARSRLRGERPDAERRVETTGDPTSITDGRSLLDRAFPGGDWPTSPEQPEPTSPEQPESVGGRPRFRADVAEAMRAYPREGVDRLLTLGRQCAHDGDWDVVDQVIDALDVIDPGRKDQVRAIATFHAVRAGAPARARDFAHDISPGSARDGWVRFAEEGRDVELPQHVVEHRDDLRGIAGRYLGDERRWSEIRDLNVGLAQPDGRSLAVDGEDIVEGWILELPPDAARRDLSSRLRRFLTRRSS